MRRKIVSTYTTLKALVDVVNHYAERRDRWESVRYQPSPGGGLGDIEAKVQAWALNIREKIPELETEIADLLGEIRKYVDSQKID